MPLSESEALVVKQLRAMAPDLEAQLCRFVKIDSHTDHHEGVNALGWEIEQELMKSGLHTSAFVTGCSGQYLMARTRHGKGNKLMLLGHLDTVFPPGSVELAVVPDPQDPLKLMGPGATDMKGGLVVMLAALRALQDVGLLAEKSLTVLLSADEETGSPAGRDLIAKEAEEHHLCLVLEAGSPDEKGGSRFVTSRKGMARFNLEIKGIAAHSGVAKEAGLSAAIEAAHKIIALEALNDASVGNSVNVGVCNSGSSVNTVPEFAHLKIDCRFSDPGRGETLVEKIRQICQTPVTSHKDTHAVPELGLEELCGHQPFVRSEAIGRMAQRIVDWGKDLGLTLEEETRGGASDGNIAAALGIPTVDGLGVVGAKIHSNQEWLYRQSIVDRSCLLALTMMRFYEL